MAKRKPLPPILRERMRTGWSSTEMWERMDALFEHYGLSRESDGSPRSIQMIENSHEPIAIDLNDPRLSQKDRSFLKRIDAAHNVRMTVTDDWPALAWHLALDYVSGFQPVQPKGRPQHPDRANRDAEIFDGLVNVWVEANYDWNSKEILDTPKRTGAVGQAARRVSRKLARRGVRMSPGRVKGRFYEIIDEIGAQLERNKLGVQLERKKK